MVWKRPVRRDCSETAAYAAMVLVMVPHCPVFVLRNAVNSRGSQFLLKACKASTFLRAAGPSSVPQVYLECPVNG